MSGVLVAGCGYVGSALAAELASRGERVVGLRRSAAALPQGVLPYSADLLVPASLSELPDDLDRVVYAVGAADRSREAYEDAYVRGLENLIEALAQRGASPRRLVFTSSTAVFAEQDGGFIDERAPVAEEGFAPRALLRAEALVRDGAREASSLRLAGIYGPGRTWLVRRVAAGEARLERAGEPPRYGNRIHRDDCAGALAHLLTVAAPPPVVIGVDDAPAPLAEVYRFVAERLGIAPPEEGDDGGGRGGNKRCSNAVLRGSGYTLRVPTYREGYPRLVDEHLAGLDPATR